MARAAALHLRTHHRICTAATDSDRDDRDRVTAVFRLNLKGAVWDAIGSLNDNFGMLGYIIIGIFALSWIASVAIYRVKRLDEVETSPQI